VYLNYAPAEIRYTF